MRSASVAYATRATTTTTVARVDPEVIKPDRLYHFTCAHGKRDIGTGPNALLIPHRHPWLNKKLLWLTVVATPDRAETGLTSTMLSCDRMRYRYVVTELEHCRPWIGSPERQGLNPEALKAFEVREDGQHARPDQWWISDVPVHARYDRSWIA
jgi:hypothetical protein